MVGLPWAFYVACGRTIFVHSARFLCTKGHFGAAATAATTASDPNQSFQDRVWTLDIGWKHLVGFEYAGWGLLHRPKDGSLLQLRTLFVHLKP